MSATPIAVLYGKPTATRKRPRRLDEVARRLTGGIIQARVLGNYGLYDQDSRTFWPKVMPSGTRRCVCGVTYSQIDYMIGMDRGRPVVIDLGAVHRWLYHNTHASRLRILKRLRRIGAQPMTPVSSYLLEPPRDPDFPPIPPAAPPRP